MRAILIILATLFLFGCSTSKHGDVVPVVAAMEELPMKFCMPPPELMIKAERLKQIKLTNGKISLKDLMKVWTSDITEYNKLRNNNNSLIDWIEQNCQ